jgi:diaminohydroxyphosphoribosylaminopyrimidine deaminase/5-amino-6-(5-phosphoribosylamino)uracil reductase
VVGHGGGGTAGAGHDSSGADVMYMDRALFHAARGRGRTSPNPLVGAVLVTSDGIVVGQGHHERAGEPHAEVRALMQAGDRARGATLYCTLEPCCHHGRTGPCVTRILDAGVARVVASVEDPNPLVHGKGFAFLEAHGVTVTVGLGADRAATLNQPFFTLMREGRPLVIVKAAASSDGRIAEAPGRRTPLTSAPANRHAHRLRAEVDAIGVGAGTILADDPLMTPRGVYRERPLVRVIFDRRLRTPAGARVLSTPEAGPVMIVTSEAAAARAELRRPLEHRGAEIVVAEPTFRSALSALGAQQIGSLLLEGGATLHAAALEDDLADIVRLYVTPHVLGAEGVPLWQGQPFSTADLSDRRVETLGPDVLIEGYVHRSH